MRGLVNQMGTVTDTYEMDALRVAIGGAWGYLTDPSGMLQLGARFYWPEVGRFVQQDPAKDGLNWYAYAGSRPTVAIDPEGLATWQFVVVQHRVVCVHVNWFWFLYTARQDCLSFCQSYPPESEDHWECRDACGTIFPGGGGATHGITVTCRRRRVSPCSWVFSCRSSTMP